MLHLNETADYKCHYCGETMKEDNNYALLRFIIHIGVNHDVFSDLLAQNNHNISQKDVTMATKNMGGHENKENKLNGLLKSPEITHSSVVCIVVMQQYKLNSVLMKTYA